MTNWYSAFYWLTRADAISHTLDIFSNWFLAFTILFTILYIFLFIASKSDDVDDRDSVIYWRKSLGKVAAASFLIMTILWTAWAFLPNKKDALIIIAGGAVGNFITRDSSAKQIPADVMLLLRTKIKEEINETSLKEAISGETDTLKDKTAEELKEIIRQKGK